MKNSNNANKEKYKEFCLKTYVPVYSKPWWMDAVCGEENWDVWLYISGGEIAAAMPYYLEYRQGYKYITKAILTQNNGIIFKENSDRKLVRQAEFEEKIINAACKYIESLQLDVYEQQYQTTFTNWMPFFWQGYTNILRYSYVIQDTSDMDKVWDGISSKYRNEIRKGQKLTSISEIIGVDDFYKEHEKVFLRQGKRCPFSIELWRRLYKTCLENNAGKILCSKDKEGNIHALLFLVWDERRVYQLLGGYIPEYSSSQAYPALIYHGIETAHKKGLMYDFEGSMIHQISIAFRQFGGVPMPYYRIRKVFNREIIRREAEEYIIQLETLS